MDPENTAEMSKLSLDDKDCTICASLRKMFMEPHFSADLGTTEDVFKNPCSGHDVLLKHIQQDWDEVKDEFVPPQDETESAEHANEAQPDAASKTRVTFSRGDEPHGEVVFQDEECGMGRVVSLLLAKTHDEEQTPGFGRILNPDWADITLAKSWLDDCVRNHGQRCCNPCKIRQVSPAWLIDCQDECIVAGEDAGNYVALSYRWGTPTRFPVDIHTRDGMQIPGSLSPGRMDPDVAPIVRHAMGLTKAIGERYLWVDAACISHSDRRQSKQQLLLMGAIYASAKLTIVAADGDAETGILGLQGISSSRKLRQETFPVLGNETAMVRKLPLTVHLSGCTSYFERGWTFQEYYLSQRRLVFVGNELQWHCTCTDWFEDLIPSEGSDKPVERSRESLEKLLGGDLSLQALDTALAEYNSRQLSYPEDALPGISGLLAIISRSFEGGFLFGLPEMAFDAALMWRSGMGSPLKEREMSGKSDLMEMALKPPSWSWLGWECFAMEIVREEAFDTWRRLWRTTPITQWYTHETPDAVDRRPIQSSWFGLEEKFRASGCEVPEGWTKEEYDDAKHREFIEECYHNHPPQGLGQYVYCHAAVPNKYFWLPVPISAVKEEAVPFLPPQTPYISCDTQRGWFAAAKAKEEDQYDAIRIRLEEDDGRYCGWLDLHTLEDLEPFPETGSGRAARVELVAVCRRTRSVLDNYPGWGRTVDEEEAREREPEWDEYYGVLWVEGNEVARRKASGYVLKEAWERHNLENLRLVLG